MNEVIVAEEREEYEGLRIVTVMGGKRLDVTIPYLALERRRAVYGLDSDEAAVEAILKEHASRELGLGNDDHSNPKLARMGGLRKDVTIRQGTVADLPPIPAPKPTAGEVAAGIIEKAGTLAEVKATLAAWLRAQK